MSAPLHCLGGQPANEAITTGWAVYQQLPDRAQRQLWEIVASGLIAPTDPTFRSRLEEFCAEHAVEESVVRIALHTCGILLGQASTFDVSPDELRRDLEVLSGGSTDGLDELCTNIFALKGALREALAMSSLADHGKVLIGLDWRIDRMASSSRGAGFTTDVVFLTLRYREGDAVDRITLQLSTQGIRELRGFLDRFGH